MLNSSAFIVDRFHAEDCKFALLIFDARFVAPIFNFASCKISALSHRFKHAVVVELRKTRDKLLRVAA